MRERLRLLTWHVRGNYLHNLTQVPHDFYLVRDAARSTHHSGRSGTLPWGDNVHDAPLQDLRDMRFDAVIYQSRDAWETERHSLLSPRQRALPRIYIEHDPPLAHPTETAHWVQDSRALLIHVTPFNAMMWNSGKTPVRVIEHGVKPLADVSYRGELARGVVVVNNIDRRGRRLGCDIFQRVAESLPLDLFGMGSERVGGLGEVANDLLSEAMASYRFFFNPTRYSSLGLAVIEAMMVGLPIVGLATTELVSVIRNRENGFVDTRPERLVGVMQELLNDPAMAAAWGEAARHTANERFHIDRFVRDWMDAIASVG